MPCRRARVLRPSRDDGQVGFRGAEQLDAHRKRQQAAHAGLTLTGMYNVLEALREGRALTAKERTLHEQGLVGVLKELHDELDAAVLEAYGWQDLQGAADGDARLLERLVALNAARAAEEKTGVIRWLRPGFQHPLLSKSERSAQDGRALQPQNVQETLDIDEPQATPASTIKAGQPAWPALLPEQVRAVVQLLAVSAAPLPLAAIEAGFKGRGPWKKSLPRILETLEALGRARRQGDGGVECWRSA